MKDSKNFYIEESLYLLLENKDKQDIISIEFILSENSRDIIINNKFVNINEIEKWIFYKLIYQALDNNSVKTEELLSSFKLLKSKVPIKKQLQKAIHNIRNELPKHLSIDSSKKHELILTKRKTQFTDDSTYRFYIPDFEIRSYIKNTSNIKNVLDFIKKLINTNNNIYLREIQKYCKNLLKLIRNEYKFYIPLINELEKLLKSFDIDNIKTIKKNNEILDFINKIEMKFISNESEFLTNEIYINSKIFLGYYYGYNFATSGEDKISQSLQKIYIDKNNTLKSKQISSEFKYFGDIKIDNNCLFNYSELLGEKGFVHEVLNKPIVATTNLKFLLGSFTAFSVDRKLCFGKRILIKLDKYIKLSDCKTGYITKSSKDEISLVFNNYFDNLNYQITKVKLPHQIDLNINSIKIDRGKIIDFEWIESNI
ncbi:MAG: hypothetical protein U0354_06945 [Candidatus Sericytochromatia bacterium]